jgi:ATP-binding cassette subfamily B protein
MIDPGTILSSVALASIVFMSFLRLIMLFIVIPRALVSGKRINEVLNTKTSILYKKDAITLDKFESLEFKHVSFKYNDNSKYILNNISFKLNKGETLAFIGATGAGKTTIIELILRLYDVNSGQILINGIDIKDLSKDTIAKLIGYVPQKISLLSGKVKDNISFGSETLSDKELE